MLLCVRQCLPNCSQIACLSYSHQNPLHFSFFNLLKDYILNSLLFINTKINDTIRKIKIMGVMVTGKISFNETKEKEKKRNLGRWRSRLLLAPAHFDNHVRSSCKRRSVGIAWNTIPIIRRWKWNWFHGTTTILFLVSCFLSLYSLLPLVFIQDNNMILHLYRSGHLNLSVCSVGAKP